MGWFEGLRGTFGSGKSGSEAIGRTEAGQGIPSSPQNHDESYTDHQNRQAEYDRVQKEQEDRQRQGW